VDDCSCGRKDLLAIAAVIRLEDIRLIAGSAVKQVALDESRAYWLVRTIGARLHACRGFQALSAQWVTGGNASTAPALVFLIDDRSQRSVRGYPTTPTNTEKAPGQVPHDAIRKWSAGIELFALNGRFVPERSSD
jgi:hypothetical protein